MKNNSLVYYKVHKMINIRIPIALVMSLMMDICPADTSQVEGGKANSRKVMIFFDNLPTMISIELDGYPNDPGIVGDTLLAGLDSDQDGVRDDVERYIVDNYSHNENVRKSLYQYAQYKQQILLAASSSDSNTVVRIIPKLQGAIECLYEVANSTSEAERILADIMSIYLNTEDRIRTNVIANKLASGYVGVIGNSGTSNTCE